MKKVAILGCGPAGLLVKHAAELCRVDAVVFSDPIKSPIGGTQFLHMAIPDITTADPEGMIYVYKWGTAEGYAAKVYGDASAPTSFDLFEQGEQPAWSLRDTYNGLWELYGDDIVPEHLKPTSIMELQRRFDLVISTIPAKALCYVHEHRFPAQPVAFAAGVAFKGGWEDFIVYSGSPEEAWYRTSSIFGVGQTEFSSASAPPRSTLGIKPLSTDCDCCKGVLRLGRFGQWKKGILTHHAFQEAMHALQQL